jgi:hypothetical protein
LALLLLYGPGTCVTDRPETLVRLDLVFGAARIAHEAIFGLHLRLAAVEAEDEDTRHLLQESARITLEALPALTAECRLLATRWEEQSLLAGAEAVQTLRALRDEMERIEPHVRRLQLRQRQVARDLRSRLIAARKGQL